MGNLQTSLNAQIGNLQTSLKAQAKQMGKLDKNLTEQKKPSRNLTSFLRQGNPVAAGAILLDVAPEGGILLR